MKLFWLVLIILWGIHASGQPCFDSYDQMFENGADSLSYEEFHHRELEFLKELKGCYPPDFSRSTLADDEIILSALQGKVVVLNFWFTTCMPCLKEIPEFNMLTEQFDSDEVVFLALARDDEATLEAFFKRFGEYKFQIIPESYDVATAYKVVGWPQTMLIDQSGTIYQSWAGRHESVQVLAAEIKEAIEECL